MLPAARVMVAWTWVEDQEAMELAAARASTGCRWAAEIMALKAAAWITWAEADMAKGPAAAIPTSTKTLTVEEVLTSAATATAK